MTSDMIFRVSAGLIAGAMLVGCGSSSSNGTTPTETPDTGGNGPTPTQTPPAMSPTPTAAPTMPPGGGTPVPSATPTMAPSAAPSPSATPTMAPSATPSPSVAPTATPTPTPTPGEAGRLDQPVPGGSTVTVTAELNCLECDVPESERNLIIDGDQNSFATATVSLGLLTGLVSDAELAVTVNLPTPITPTLAKNSAPERPGFLVSFPDVTLLSLALLPELEVRTLLDGDEVDSRVYGFGFFNSIALGTILQDINNAAVYLPVDATGPYNAVQLRLRSTIANALLSVNIHEAGLAGVGGSISGDFPEPGEEPFEPEPQPTVTPEPSATPTPSGSPAPTQMPTPTPTPTPGESGRLDAPAPAVGTTVEVTTGLACGIPLACTVDDLENILDPNPENFATANLNLSLLSALEDVAIGDEALGINVVLSRTVAPTEEAAMDVFGNPILANSPGFVISFPDPILTASVLPQIRVSLLNGGEVVGEPNVFSYGIQDGVAFGSFLNGPLLPDINNARVFIGTQATEPYDTIRIGFTGSILDLLLAIQVHQVGISGVSGSISGDF